MINPLNFVDLLFSKLEKMGLIDRDEYFEDLIVSGTDIDGKAKLIVSCVDNRDEFAIRNGVDHHTFRINYIGGYRGLSLEIVCYWKDYELKLDNLTQENIINLSSFFKIKLKEIFKFLNNYKKELNNETIQR